MPTTIRRASAISAIAVAMLLAISASAYAGSNYFWDGGMAAGFIGSSSPVRHSVNQVSARKLDSLFQRFCVNAHNAEEPNLNELAGDWNCSYAYDTVAFHTYCACQLRRGLLWNDGASSGSFRARMDW